MLKQVRRALLLAFVFSGFVNVLMLATPLYTLQVFETVVPLGSIETLVILTAITAASVLALALIEIVRDLILARAGVWADHELGQFMLENGLRAGLPVHQMRHDLRALDTLRGFISGPAVTPFFDGPWVPIFLVALAVLHPMLGLLGLVSAGLLFTASLLQAAATDRLQRESAQARERAAQWWSLATGNPPLSGALGLAGGVSDAWEVANRGHVAGAYSLAKRASVVKALARAVRIGSQIAVYAIGAWLVVNDQVTPGVLVASAILLARALAPLEQLVGAIKPAIAAWRAYRTLKELPDDVRHAPLDDEDGVPPMQIALQDVTVYLPGRKMPALRGINLEIAPGQSLGLVGPNGSGKSTLAGVIAGAIVPAAGTADIAGVAISRWQRGSDTPLIGYLPDEPLLVDGTVHQNIVRFTDASLMAAAAAAMKVGVHERLQSLPMGYESEVGPAGQALSLSERRAVAMARAVCGDPGVIVLDEPEAGLDGTGIRQLMRALEELKAKGTTLVIATQDPRLLRVVDRVAVLSSGSIAKMTTPADMLRGNAPAKLTPRGIAADEGPASRPRVDATAGGAA